MLRNGKEQLFHSDTSVASFSLFRLFGGVRAERRVRNDFSFNFDLPRSPNFFLGRKFPSSRTSFFRTLSAVFGLGRSRIFLVSVFLGVSRFSSLGPVFFYKKRAAERFCSAFFLDRGLRKFYSNNIFEKKKAGSYVGLRLTQKLPSRGQRTRSNGKTARECSPIKD